MTDFATYIPTLTGPASALLPITPNDSEDLAQMARAIRCKPVSGAAGTLRVTTISGDVADTEINAGETLVLMVRRVHATGTTATGLEALR